MILKSIMLLVFIIFSIGLVAQHDDKILIQKNGHTLTDNHLNIYIEGLISDGIITRSSLEAKLTQIKDELFIEFGNDSEGTLDFIEYYRDMLASETGNKKHITETAQSNIHLNPSGSIGEISAGNQHVRDILGHDIGQMEFDTEKANSFRSYMKNSLFYDSSSNYGQSLNGSHYSNSSAKIYFCENGTYTQVLSGHISIHLEGASAYSSGDDDDDIQRGYWEVSYLPNGWHMILMYSTDPLMLEDSPNGLLPFPILSYTNTYVVMPDGTIPYKREGGHSCN